MNIVVFIQCGNITCVISGLEKHPPSARQDSAGNLQVSEVEGLMSVGGRLQEVAPPGVRQSALDAGLAPARVQGLAREQRRRPGRDVQCPVRNDPEVHRTGGRADHSGRAARAR